MPMILDMKNLHSGHMDTTHVDSDLHATNTKLQPAWAEEGSAVCTVLQPRIPMKLLRGLCKNPKAQATPPNNFCMVRTFGAKTQASEFAAYLP